MWNVDFRLGGKMQRTLAQVGNDADNLPGFWTKNLDGLADWILTREVSLRHRLVDDGNKRRIGTIRRVEASAGQEWNAHGTVITGRSRGEVRRQQCLGRRSARNCEGDVGA